MFPKTQKIRDKAYLRYVASLPCCICKFNTSTVVAHHLLHSGTKGMGMKAGDNETLPLCFFCHAELHRKGNETEWLETHGINGKALAAQLWKDRK